MKDSTPGNIESLITSEKLCNFSEQIITSSIFREIILLILEKGNPKKSQEILGLFDILLQGGVLSRGEKTKLKNFFTSQQNQGLANKIRDKLIFTKATVKDVGEIANISIDSISKKVIELIKGAPLHTTEGVLLITLKAGKKKSLCVIDTPEGAKYAIVPMGHIPSISEFQFDYNCEIQENFFRENKNEA